MNKVTLFFVVRDDIDTGTEQFGHVFPGIVLDMAQMIMLVYEAGNVNAECFLERKEAEEYSAITYP